MKLTFIGHAGFLVEYKNTLIIIDPWLSKRGAFDSAWMQFPCNHHLDSLVLNKLNDFTHIYIYLSHEHKDHFDIEILNKILQSRSDAIFLIPNFKSKAFLNELISLKPKHVRELTNDEHYPTQELDIYLFMDESGINHDSAILIKAGMHSFLNLNDCKIFDRLEYIKNKYGPINVFTVQFSGASWHPICYEMPESEYKLISKKKKSSKYRAILNALKTLKPNRYLPTAGPPALLDPMHYEINLQKESIFPHQYDVIGFLKSFNLGCHLDSIMPGDVYCFATDRYVTLSDDRVSEENFKATIEIYANKSKYLYDENEQYKPDNLEELFQNYFHHIQAKTAIFSIKETIQHQIYFAINEIENRYISVDLNNQTCIVTNKLPTDNYYSISYPAWQIRKLVEGHTKGEDLALTFRGKMKRSPDMYNTWISCFVNTELEHLPENIKLIENIRENKEKIEVECNGKRYQIKRYCPHQGADLQYGWADGNNWVCPKHRWQYDLAEGGACKSANVSVDAVELVPEKVDV